MRYELYGVSPDGADIQHVSTSRFFEGGIRDVESLLDSEAHPDFLVLEKTAKNQAPIACSYGYTANGYVHRQTSFVLGFDPTQTARDFQAYRDGWHMRAAESYEAYRGRKQERVRFAVAEPE